MSNLADKNIRNWEEIYRDKKAGSFLNYPNEILVTLFFQNRSQINQAGKCLDYGFGSGNNAEFLIQHMEELYGMEISASSVAITRERLSHYPRFNPQNFKLSDAQQDVDAACFDLIVAWQVLYYNDHDSIQAAIAKLCHYLKPGGILICSLSTHRDVKVVHATAVATNTYIVDERIPHQQGCKIFSPANEQQFLELFPAVEMIDVGYFERKSFKAENTLSEYYLVAKKR